MTVSAFNRLPDFSISDNLMDRITSTVGDVEQELSVQTGSDSATAQLVARHTLQAGGKRIRPAFVSLCASATGNEFDSNRVTQIGAAMELIHMATLIHDDVVDHSATRRGKPTAHSLYGDTQSILSGDSLLAKAMVLLASDGDLDLVRAIADSVRRMAEGEVEELAHRNDFDLDEDIHLNILELKTAAFIQACCEAGARIGGATSEVRRALSEYGRAIGIAFQIADDILDYRGRGEETGKPHAIDFRDGQATLPLIRLRGLLSTEELAVLKMRFGNGISDDEIRMICGWMDTRGALESTEKTARAFVSSALAALAPLPESEAKSLLAAFANYIVERRS